LLAGGIGAIAGGSYLIQQWLKSTEQIEKDTSKTTNDDLTSDTAGANGQSTTAGEETRPEKQNEVINHIKLAERSLQEAIVAYIQADQTVARIRFRKARDIFKDAHKAIVESEADLLTEPVAVDAQLDRKLSSTTISGLPGIPETAATELTEAGIETVDDLDGGAKSSWTPAAVEELVDDEKIEKDIATTLTLLSWWHGDESYEFDTAEAVESRQQQADYGFNHSS
jgi:hypothetical protein